MQRTHTMDFSSQQTCLGWWWGVTFISTVKMPAGISSRAVSERKLCVCVWGGGSAHMEIDQCAVTVHLV